MELVKAKEQVKEIIKEYSEKISKFGVKIAANVYYVESKSFLECNEDDKNLDSLCGSITVYASDADDENGMCGFDIVLGIKKRKTVDDSEFERSITEYRKIAEDFVKRFEEAPDKDEFIKAESEQEKAESAEQMKKFEDEMKKLKIGNTIVIAAVVLLVIIAIFSVLLI